MDAAGAVAVSIKTKAKRNQSGPNLALSSVECFCLQSELILKMTIRRRNSFRFDSFVSGREGNVALASPISGVRASRVQRSRRRVSEGESTSVARDAAEARGRAELRRRRRESRAA